MNSIRTWLAVGLASLFAVAGAQAQTYTHAVYLDLDRNVATGCSTTTPAGTVNGAEARVSAVVSGQPPIVTTVTREVCSSGVFGSPTPQTSNYPVGLNLGIGGSDVVEFSTALLGLPTNGLSNLTFVSSSASGADLVVAQGVSLPGQGVVVDPAIVPATGWLALLLLVGVMLWLVRRHPRFGASMAVLLVLGAGVAWAANFVMDGQIPDWSGVAPRATDANNDATSAEPGIELVAVFAQPEGARLYFRSDVRDAQNQPPVANPQSVSLLEEGTLAITLTATDAEGAAMTFAIAAAPTRGTLSAITPIDATSASVQYTGNLNQVGADSFTFTASDGIATSAPATVSVTLNPVNDAPSLASVNPPAVLEDSGGATVANWAVFVPGPADEAAQTALAYTVTAVGTPALFSTPPSVAPNGTLSYTPAPNANGTSTFSVTVQDNGGIANGGIDTSTAQTFTITVTAVNDAPSFTAGANPSSAEDAGPQVIAAWATALQDGDPEVVQGLSFGIGTIGNPALFATPPQVNAAGDLSYTSAPNANGSSTVEIRIQDDGGTANGGINVSAFQTITITVTPVDDAPFAVADSATVAEDSSASTILVLANDTDIDAGAIAVNSVTQPTNGVVVNNGGDVSYTPNADYCNTAPPGAADAFTYTLAPGGSTATVSVTVSCVNDAPVNTVPGAQNVGASATLSFSSGNSNAISLADLDAGSGNLELTLDVGAGNGSLALNPAATGALASLTGQGSATLVATGTAAALNAALEGATYTAPAVPPPPPSTVTLSVTIDDQGNSGTGGALSDTDTIAIAIDDAPSVLSIVPANGATQQGNVTDIVVTFSEAIDAIAGAVIATCAPSGATTSSPLQTNVTSITLVGTTLGAADGDTCSVTVFATTVTDVDAIDPPDQMAADVTASYTIDVAPAFVGSTPADSTVVAIDTTFSATFTEAVTAAAGAITLDCGGAISGTLSGSGTTTLVFSPDADLPAGASCTATLVAAAISDADAGDPPDTLAANVPIPFTTDAAPAVIGGAPAAAATRVSTATAVTFDFSESVTAGAGAITLDCGGAIAGTLSGSGTTTLTFTPSAPLPADTLCTATAVGLAIADSDAIDPPNNPVADVARSFTTDAAPSVTGSTPADGAIDVGIVGIVSFTFSEPVSASVASFNYLCNATPVTFTLAGDGTANLTLTPTSLLPINSPCTVTVIATGIDDVDLGDPPANLAADFSISFTTVNDNAPTVLSSAPADGATVANNVALAVNFSEPVDATAGSVTLSCNSGPNLITAGTAGTGVSSLAPAYTAPLPAGTCVLTVLAANIVDADAIDPPDQMVANFVATFTVDAAPSVSAVSPANAATDVALNATITFDFSESVDIASPAAFTLQCPLGSPVPFAVTTPATLPASATSFTLTPLAPLPGSTVCTVGVVAAQVEDTDGFDPPQTMAANFSSTFTTVDDAPTLIAAEVEVANVFSALPLGGGVFADADTNLRVTFSEPVNPNGNWAELSCALSGVQSTVAGLGVTSADPVFTLNPTANLTPGESCTFTVFANQIADDDGVDPPDNLAADLVFNFIVRDVAPTVLSTTPIAAAIVPNTQTVTINFSEPVDLGPGSVTFTCGVAVAFTPALPQNNLSSITLTPTGALPDGANCSVTLESTLITDDDVVDPPNELDGNASLDVADGDADDFTLNFSVDQAPSVTTTNPANGATNVLPTSPITVNFSESVNFDTTANAANTSFDLECPTGTPANFTVLTAPPAASVQLNPLDSAVAGATCTLTVRAAGITDADLIDPPQNMLADFAASFSFASIAENDAYDVTPHLTLSIPASSGGAQGGGVVNNDTLGSGAITGFGFAPACATNLPGVQLDAGAANGRLTLNADGSLAYEPPAGVANATRTFCYTVTGGDTANIAFTLENEELLWFVNAAAPAGGIGTQARPFQTLAAATAVDTADDAIFLAANVSAYTGGITLAANESLIGDGSTDTLENDLGYAPVAGSAFPVPSGTAPTITCGGTCITLATGNRLLGFTVGDSSAGGTDVGGTAFGTLTVRDLTLTGNGRALALTTGTVDGNLVDLNATSNGVEGALLNAVGGTLTVTGQVDITTTGVSAGLRIVNAPANASFTFSGGVVSSSANNAAVSLDNNNAAGVVVNLGIVTLTGNTGLLVTNSPMTLGGTTGTISTANGPAISATNSVLGASATLASVSSSNSGAEAINLVSVTGNLTMNGGSLTNATGTTFAIGNATPGSGGSSNVTYAGTITDDVGTLVNVRNATGGTKLFSGAITDGNDGDGNGISLTGNTGATINFTGGLTLSTGANAAFTATGGGTVNVTGASNTLVTTSGTALNISNTLIGASDVTFRSISANGAVNGIVLNTTGTTGGLTVTGNSAGLCGGQVAPSGTPGVAPAVTVGVIGDCTGGIIENTTGDAIVLNRASDVSLTRMLIRNVTGANAQGIDADNIAGSHFFRNGHMTNVGGAGSGDGNGITIVNVDTDLNLFSVEDSYFANSLSGTSHVLNNPNGPVDMRIDVIDSIFEGLEAIAVQSNSNNNAIITTNLLGNVFRNAGANGQGGTIIATAAGSLSEAQFVVSGNAYYGLNNGVASGANAGTAAFQTTGGPLIGTVANNVIGIAGAGNDNGDRRGIEVVAEPDVSVNGNTGSIDVIIENNFINRYDDREAIFVDLREDTLNSELIIRNNNIGNLVGFEGQVGGIREAVDVQVRGETNKTLNLLMTGNNIRSDASVFAVNLEVNNDATAVAAVLSLQATVTGNTIRADTAGAPTLTTRTRAGDTGSVACLDMSGNTLVGAPAQVQLNEDGGPLNVEQASSAALSAANGGVGVVATGTPQFGVACQVPPT